MMFLVSLILCGTISAFYIPSQGGVGVDLGFNLSLILCLGILLIGLTFHNHINERLNKSNKFIFPGIAAMGLPWTLSIAESPGIIVLIVVFLLWWISQSWFLSTNVKKQIILLIFSLALIQCIIAIFQTFFPSQAFKIYEYSWIHNNGRPYGIFQQYNLLASFLATGVGCGFFLVQKEKRKFVVGLYLSGLTVLCFVIALIQSRAGMLGAILVIIAITTLHGFDQKVKTFICLIFMATGISAGTWVVHHTHIIVDGQLISMAREFKTSTYARLSILKATLEMIAVKPLSGWGYGTFEYEFSRYIIAHPSLNVKDVGIVPHPHNEILFAWFQGGIIALIGILLLLLAWIKNILSAWKEKNGSVGITMLIIPLLIHTNLEYPFYQSFIHLAVFVILFRIGENDSSEGDAHTKRDKIIMLFMGFCLVGYSLIALYAHTQLTRYERTGYINFPKNMPWYFKTNNERARYDAMVALLIDYNNTHNPDDLALFMRDAEKYSLKHNDRNIWLSMIMISKFQGDVQKTHWLENDFKQIFLDN